MSKGSLNKVGTFFFKYVQYFFLFHLYLKVSMSRVTSAGLLTELFERINCGNRVRFVIFYYLKLTATFAYRNKNINLEYLNVQKSFIIYI